MKSIYFHRDLKHFNSLSAINTHYRVNFIRFWKVVKFVLLNILKYKLHIKNYLKEEIKKNEEIILSADILVMHIWTRCSTAFTIQLRMSSRSYTKFNILVCLHFKIGYLSRNFFLSYLLLLFCWFASVNIIYLSSSDMNISIYRVVNNKKKNNHQVTNLCRAPPPPRKRNNKLEYEISWLQCNIYES